MALENRSKPRQVVYLALAFGALLALLDIFARWNV
jgi:preprotein translocase subunit Sec61beta